MSLFENEDSNKTIMYVVIGALVLYIIMQLCSSYGGKEGGAKPKGAVRFADSGGKSDKATFYYSPSCPHCTRQKDIMSKSGLLDRFEAVNCQESPDRCKGVSGVPMFSKGSEKLVGVQSKEKLEAFVNS